MQQHGLRKQSVGNLAGSTFWLKLSRPLNPLTHRKECDLCYPSVKGRQLLLEPHLSQQNQRYPVGRNGRRTHKIYHTGNCFARCEVPTVTLLDTHVFWDGTTCRVVNSFRGANIGMFLSWGSTSQVSDSSTMIRLVDSENMSQSMEGIATLRNVGNALPVDTAKHLRRVQTEVYIVFFQKE
jgi:hypothetical protein